MGLHELWHVRPRASKVPGDRLRQDLRRHTDGKEALAAPTCRFLVGDEEYESIRRLRRTVRNTSRCDSWNIPDRIPETVPVRHLRGHYPRELLQLGQANCCLEFHHPKVAAASGSGVLPPGDVWVVLVPVVVPCRCTSPLRLA